MINTLNPRQNGRHLKYIFVNEYMILEYFYNDILQGPSWQWSSLGSDDGLIPNRRTAIIQTNGGRFFYAYMSVRPYKLITGLNASQFTIYRGGGGGGDLWKQEIAIYPHIKLSTIFTATHGMGYFYHKRLTSLSTNINYEQLSSQIRIRWEHFITT